MRYEFISVWTPGPEHYPHSFRPTVNLTDSNCVSSCKYLRNESMFTWENFLSFHFYCWFFSSSLFYIWYVSTHLWFTMRSIQWHKKEKGISRSMSFCAKTMTMKKIFYELRSFSVWCVCECMSVNHSNVNLCGAFHSIKLYHTQSKKKK